MSGNEIAKLSTVITCDTRGIDKAFAIIKGGLQNTDTKLNNFKTAVINSSKELQKSQIALATYKLQLSQTGNKTEEVKKKLKDLTTAVDRNKLAFNENKMALSIYERSLTTANAKTGFLAKGLETVGATMTGVAVGATVALITGLTALSIKSTQIAADFEQLKVSFEVLTGGKETADKLVDSIINLANVTPMTTQGLSQNATTLLAFGESVNNIIPDLRMLGDISGGNQDKMNALTLAFSQCGSAGRLMGQDLLQMVGVGFNPVEQMSKTTGKSMGQLRQEMEKGLISFSMVKQSMIDATSAGGRYYQMMVKQSQTLTGILSTVADKWTMVGKAIGDRFLPVAKKAGDWLVSIADKLVLSGKGTSDFEKHLDELKEVLQENANSLKIVVSGLVDLKNMIGAVIPGTNLFSDTVTTMNANLTKLGLTLQAIVMPLKVFKKESTFQDVAEGWGKIGAKWRGLDNRLSKQKTLVFTTKQKVISTETLKSPSKGGFKDSGKTGGSTKKGKTYDTVLNEHANLIKSQSDLDIAQNNYTDAQILQKKIELQRRLIALYRSTSIKGQAEQIQSQTELLNLEKQYQDQSLNDKIAALQQEASVTKAYKAMDTTEKLSNLKLTEQEKAKIVNDAKSAELQAEVRLQQAILELKRKGVTDLSQLSQKDREEYERQLLSKLQAEQNFQQQVVDTAQAGRAAEVQAARELSNTITDGFRGMINGTYSVQQAFGSMLENIAMDIASSGIENMLTNIFKGSGIGGGGVISNFIGTATGSPALGSFFNSIGFRANGGNPDGSRPFIAGERGAELVVPSNKTKVFTNKETQGIFSGGGGESQGQSMQPIIVSNQLSIKAWDGKDVVNTMTKGEGKNAILKAVGDAIDLNQGQLRNKIKNV